MANPYLEKIHSTPRNVMRTTMFGQEGVHVILLNFIGANGYFITNFGAVYERTKTYTDKDGKLVKYYQPLVMRDSFYPYPWVLLKTTFGQMWYPINHLLGWAFKIPENMEKQYCISKEEKMYPYTADDLVWTKEPPVRNDRSRYLQFVNYIYDV